MAKLKDIVDFLNDYLKTDEFEDYSFNGLQYEGKEEVKRIMFAVDAGIDTFKRAIKRKADMIIVHHGHFWKADNPSIRGWAKERLRLLGTNNISLYVSHLPLDAHKVVGNNAQLLKILGAKPEEEFCIHNGKSIGWIGTLPKPISLDSAKKKLEKEIDHSFKILPFGKKDIKRIAVVSGGGNHKDFYEAASKKADLYITGDSTELYHPAKDIGINVIFAGHHATETVGLKALGEVTKKKFKIECFFEDLPTGL